MSDAPAPVKKTNRIGLELAQYRGAKTTLCAGCGHNAITERIIDACYEMGIDAKKVVKLSGIGSPCMAASRGFESKVSNWEGPPAMVSQITRLARCGNGSG